ncbi:unnamed protein product [Caenorhabditis sp. 36 PRJEB53466]|nr:unnamed protein product [Caenorhabditis sp. 36 PRJEB53466]
MRYLSVEEEARSIVETGNPSTTATFGTSVDALCNMIRSLLNLDSRRTVNFEMMRSTEDPTIEQLISRTTRGFTINPATNTQTLSEVLGAQQVLSQWSFFGIWTTVEFLNSLDFMHLLQPSDKQVLLKSFAMKAYLLASAFRSSSQSSEVLVNPDGTEVYPTSIQQYVLFNIMYETISVNLDYRSLEGLSEYSKQIVSENQRKYTKSLLDYCKMTWRDEQGPARFHDILSVGNVMAKCFEDAQYLVTILQIFHPSSYNYKKLFMESLNK